MMQVPAMRNVLPSAKNRDDNHVWRIYGFWCSVVGVTFLAIYPLCNWISTQRASVYHFYLPAELLIPLEPVFIWCYLSLYALFLAPPFLLKVQELRKLGRSLVAATVFSGLLFLVLPTQLGFARELPEEPLYRPIFSALFSLDHPYNLAPSLHVVYSTLVVLALTAIPSHRRWRPFWWLWLLLLCLSTLLVHQHHLADILSGLLVASLFSARPMRNRYPVRLKSP